MCSAQLKFRLAMVLAGEKWTAGRRTTCCTRPWCAAARYAAQVHGWYGCKGMGLLVCAGGRHAAPGRSLRKVAARSLREFCCQGRAEDCHTTTWAVSSHKQPSACAAPRPPSPLGSAAHVTFRGVSGPKSAAGAVHTRHHLHVYGPSTVLTAQNPAWPPSLALLLRRQSCLVRAGCATPPRHHAAACTDADGRRRPYNTHQRHHITCPVPAGLGRHADGDRPRESADGCAVRVMRGCAASATHAARHAAQDGRRRAPAAAAVEGEAAADAAAGAAPG